MPVTLDLRKAWRSQQHGDLTVVMTWVNDARALVLLPTYRRDAGWYIVAESAAYLWGVDHPDPVTRRDAMAHAMEQSVMACMQLGLEASRPNRARVIGIITGWIPDLVRMPSAPLPEMSQAAYGDVTLSVDGKVVAQEETRVPIDEGTSYG